MDLILMEPGNPDVFANSGGRDDSGSVISNAARGRLPPQEDGASFGKCIELVSVQHGMKQQITTDVSNSARSSNRPIITEFTCVKYVDKTSVKLYEYCLRAEPIGKGKDQPTKIYVVRNSGDSIATIMTFALRDAIISEIQFQSHPDDMPTEQFKLNFTEILWTSAMQDAGTRAAGQVLSGWSIARNRPIAQFTD